MKNKRMSSPRLRLIISIFIFIIIAVVYLTANPPVASSDLALDSSNLLTIAAALIAAIGAAQPVGAVIDAILDFFAKQNETDIPLDLREKILENQRRLWIDGILKRSIENDPLIVPYNEIRNIKFDREDKDNKFQWEIDDDLKKKIQKRLSSSIAERGLSNRKSVGPVKGYKTIIDAYVASSGQLVILGKGGSGKTIALLQLLEHLYNEARQDSKEYIPIVFNLGSWEEKQLSLTEWLASELLDSFLETPEGLLRVLTYQVKRQRMIFLFDGLDEISKLGRNTFYKGLLEFSQKAQGHAIRFVICSRPEEFAEIETNIVDEIKKTSSEIITPQYKDVEGNEPRSKQKKIKSVQVDELRSRRKELEEILIDVGLREHQTVLLDLINSKDATQFLSDNNHAQKLEELKDALSDKRLLNHDTILLRPIDDEAIVQFLAGEEYEQIRTIIFGMDDKAIGKFLSARNAEGKKKAIREKHKLYDPSHHPFILNALAVGYKNPPEQDIKELEKSLRKDTHMLVGDGLQPIPDVVMERYVSQRFDNAEAGDYELYNQEVTNDYLSWVVQKLDDTAESRTNDEDKTIRTEISIEKLQPTWLDTDNWRLAYSLVSRALSTAAITVGVGFLLASPLDYLIAGMIAGIVIGVLDYMKSRPAFKNLEIKIGPGWFRVVRFLISLLSCWITLSIYLGLITAAPVGDKIFGRIAISGITLAWFLSIFIAVIYITREFRLKLGDIEPAEILRFELDTMGRYALIGGLSIGVFVGAFAQVLLTTQTSSTGIWLAQVISTMGIGWIGAAIIGFLAGAFFGGLFAGVFGLLSVSSIQDYERTRPNQGIRKSIFNAFRVGLSLAVVFSGVFFVPLWITYQEPAVILFRAIRNGLAIGVLGGLWSGGISTIHQIVLQFFLFVSGRTPWSISRFLRYCSQINIMREIGGSYKFGHEYVRLYYSKDDVPDAHPRWLFIFGALGIFVVSFGLGSLRQSLNTAMYSIDHYDNDVKQYYYRVGDMVFDGTPTEYVFSRIRTGDKIVEEIPEDRRICLQKGQKITVESRGVIRTGDYVGYVTPEGTELGIFGISQGGAFNIESDIPNNVLTCKVDTETKWQACARPPENVILPMPWLIREGSYIASRDGYLQFDTNDNEPEKRKGAFFVVVTIDSGDQPANTVCSE